jgi:hypothetical protein
LYELFIAVTHLTIGASVIIVALCHYHHWPSSGHTRAQTHTHSHTPSSQNNDVRNVLPVNLSLCRPRQMSAISNFPSLTSASVITDISRRRNNLHRVDSRNTIRELWLLLGSKCGSLKMQHKMLQRERIESTIFIYETTWYF